MKVIVFTSKNNIYANKIIKELFLIKGVEISAIVESGVIYPGKENLNAVISIFRKSGLSYLLSQIIKFLFFKIGSTIYKTLPNKNPTHILFSYDILAKKHNIPIHIEKDINSKTFVQKITKNKSHLFISVFLNQIFKPKLLSVPKIGTLNIHPALLPSYKGLSPVFWVLANGEVKTGITIHWVDNQIDSGKILSQKEVPISPNDTEFSLYLRCVNEGISLLRPTLNKVKAAKESVVKNVSLSPSYYSFPTRKDVKRFKDKGKKFLTLRQLFISR